jgi:hypothetical protein
MLIATHADEEIVRVEIGIYSFTAGGAADPLAHPAIPLT